jgi:hypothetical protein
LSLPPNLLQVQTIIHKQNVWEAKRVSNYSVSQTLISVDSFIGTSTSAHIIMAHFITACVFQKGIKTVKIDKATMYYYMRLTSFYSQFRTLWVVYNQVVKILYQKFSEKKASVFLYKLEKQTIEFGVLSQKIISLTEEFEEKHLKK